MKDEQSRAFLVRAYWEDDRYPGIYLSKLYAARTENVETAIEAVRKLRLERSKVMANGDRLTPADTKRMRIRPGEAVAITERTSR